MAPRRPRTFEESPHLVGAVTMLARLCQERLNDRLRPLGLTYAQAVTLVRLWLSDERSVPQGELVESLVMARATGTQLLNQLEEAGLVRRQPSRDDRRRLVVELTAVGKRLETRVLAAFEELEDELASLVPSADYERTTGLTRELAEHLVRERRGG